MGWGRLEQALTESREQRVVSSGAFFAFLGDFASEKEESSRKGAKFAQSSQCPCQGAVASAAFFAGLLLVR